MIELSGYFFYFFSNVSPVFTGSCLADDSESNYLKYLLDVILRDVNGDFEMMMELILGAASHDH